LGVGGLGVGGLGVGGLGVGGLGVAGLGVRGLGVGGLGVGGLDVRGLGVGGLDVGVERVSSRHRGLLRAMVLHVAKSVGRSLRFSAFLSVLPKFLSGHRICKSQGLFKSQVIT
jgi:hypothetical protein